MMHQTKKTIDVFRSLCGSISPTEKRRSPKLSEPFDLLFSIDQLLMDNVRK
jgi:hypothetical protein